MIDVFSAFAFLKKAFSVFSRTILGKFAISAGLSFIAQRIAVGLSTPPAKDDRGRERVTSLDGNVLGPGSPIPRVWGTQRIFPALLCEPFYYYQNGQEYVEACYGLAGPHDLEDVQVNGAPVESIAGIEIMTRDGSRRQRPQNMIRRYGFTETANAELSGHALLSDGVTLDLSSGDLSTALPQPQVFRKVQRADEFWVQFAFPGGLNREASSTVPVRVPFRVRIRRVGSADWRNLPEVHYRGRSQQISRATVRLVWTSEIPVLDAAGDDGFVQAFVEVPEQPTAPPGGWTADAYFDDGTGDAWLDQNNTTGSRVRRMQFDAHEARFYLNPASFEPGEYDVEIVRGAAFRDGLFTASGYTYSGTVRDWFGYYDTPARIAESRASIQDTCTLVRAVSVVNQTPTPDGRVAVIAIRAQGVTVQRLSVRASGLVRAWNGTAWVQFQRSDNPADIYREILTSDLQAKPRPWSEIDDAALIEWREACEDNGWRCNGVAEDTTVPEALRIAAGAGYARPSIEGLATVIRDRDRTGEDPVHIFTPRNSRAAGWQKTFGNAPNALRVVYRDENSDRREVIVNADGVLEPGALVEQIEYESVQTEAEARKRALYDLRTSRYRGTVYAIDAPPAALALLPGSLVGLVSDEMHDLMAAGVIQIVQAEAIGTDGASVYYITTGGVDTAFYQVVSSPVLNSRFQSIGYPSFDDADTMDALVDMRRHGARLVVAVQLEDGSWEEFDAGAFTGETNILVIDAPEGVLRHGAEVGIYMQGSPLRMVVMDIVPAPDLTAKIALAPDASAEIWGA